MSAIEREKSEPRSLTGEEREGYSHDGTHEVLEFVDGTESDLLEFGNESLPEETLTLPEFSGNVESRKGGTFLT